jgi:hypothetical protein
MRFAELIGVSYASVNRWENGQTCPSPLAWRKIVEAGEENTEVLEKESPGTGEIEEESKANDSPMPPAETSTGCRVEFRVTMEMKVVAGGQECDTVAERLNEILEEASAKINSLNESP